MMTFEPRAMAMLTRLRTSSMARSQRVAAAGRVEQPVDGEGLVARGLPVLVDVGQLGQVVVVDDRVGQDDLPARRRASGSSRLPSGPSFDRLEVTSSSRMASSGGFVTWANSWVK